MKKNPEAFRKRFNAYKNGKSVKEIYSFLPGYDDGHTPILGLVLHDEEQVKPNIFLPNIFLRPDKTYFYQDGDQLVDVTPIMTSLGDDPSMWTYIDSSGKMYTPKQNKPTQGEIILDNRSSGEKFWDRYVGELKYDINNDRVVGGKYTLPAIGLGALGLYTAGAAGSSAAMPALNEAVSLVGKNIWGNAARNFALSMLGGGVVDNATKLATGYSWGQNISAGTGGWIPEILGDFTNPGYLLSGESGNLAYNSAKETIQNFPKQLNYLKKQITAEKRAKSLAERMEDFYKLRKSDYLQLQKNIREQLKEARIEGYTVNDQYNDLRNRYTRDFKSTAAGNAEANFGDFEDNVNVLDLLHKLKINPVTKDSDAASTVENLISDSYKRVPDFSKMSGADIVKFINKNAPSKFRFNLTKGNAENITSIPGLEAFINMDIGGGSIKDDGATALRMLLENGGYTLTPSGNILSQKNIIPFDLIFKTGNFSIPKFGTNETVEGMLSVQNPGRNVEINPIDVIRSISDKKIVPRQVNNSSTQYSAQIPESLGDVLLHNIEYLKEMFPGAKPFGSSTTSAYAGTPHVTHDIDLLLSDADFVTQVEKKLGGRTGSGWSVASKPNNTGFEDTYTHSLGELYGDAGNIDFNIIYTDPDTGMASSEMGTRGLELFKLFFPADYRAAMMEAMRTGNPIKINKTPKELIDAYDPTVKTILDSFSSNKAKHVPRAEAHLTTTDPLYVSKALDLYAQEKLGGQAQRIPTTREMFTDVEQNRRIFDDLGYKGVDRETVVNDPDKMKNLVDYWYYHNSIFGRGVDSGNIRFPKGTKDYIEAVDNSFRQWIGLGGNANGPGLNTVTLGNSGHGDVYGYILPKLKFDNSQSAEELIQSAKRQLGYYSYRFTDPEKQLIEEILSKYGQSILGKNVNTAEDLLRSMYIDTNSSKQALQEISDKLGIRALSKENLYDSSGRYNSMTGNVTAEDALMYAPKSSQEMPVSDVIRDRKTVQEASRDENELKSEIEQLADKRWLELRQVLFGQNRLYRTRKEFEPLKVARKYEDMSDAEFDKFADRKINKTNPGLALKKKQLDSEIDNLERQSNSLLDKILSAEGRMDQAYDISKISYRLKRNRKNAMSYAITGAAMLLPPAAIIYGAYKNAKFDHEFLQSAEFSLFLKDPRYDKALDSDDNSFKKLLREYEYKYKRRIRKERAKQNK